MRQKNVKNKGFTLIELIIVVAVLAILVGILAPSYTKYVKRSKVAKCEAQREAIERAFQLAAIENGGLAGIVDIGNADLTTIMGSEPIKRLAELGYLEDEAPKCPVYNVLYKLNVVNTNGIITVEATCPCVDILKGFVEQAYDLITSYPNKNKKDDTKMIEDIFTKYGSLPSVSDSMKKDTYFSDKNLYWRPYAINEPTRGPNGERKYKIILYASGTNSKDHAGWNASLIYVDGKIYQSTNTDTKNGNVVPAATGIAGLSNATSDTLDQKLKELGFEPVKK